LLLYNYGPPAIGGTELFLRDMQAYYQIDLKKQGKIKYF